MSAVFDLVVALLFCPATIAIARLDRQRGDGDRLAAWSLAGLCTLTVFASLMYAQDPVALARGFGSAVVLGSLPLGARMIHREGIDLIDTGVSAFTGFVLGVSSWGLAWKVMVGSVAIAGALALLHLARRNESTRVSFAYVLAGLASIAAIRVAVG